MARRTACVSLLSAAVTIVLALGLGAAPAPAQTAPDFDLLIRGGRVVDGTGNPGFVADVAIKQGRIAAIGKLGGRTAARAIDAAGLVVAPGFIDMHNHSDDTILADGDAQSMIRQGVTSMILGEGGSAAPSDRFPDFKSYFAKVLEKGVSTNVGSYIGSGQVWERVHGPRSGPASKQDRERMQAIVRQAMEQGALGVASSLSGPPGAWIETDTLVAMCQAAAPYGGIYSTHMRTEGLGVFEAVDEAIAIGRRAGVLVDIIHLKIAEHTLWGKMPALIDKIAAARAQGADVQAHVYPYRAGQNNLSSIVPPWAHEGGRKAMIDRLRDPGTRKEIENDVINGIPGWYNHYTAVGGWEGMQLVSLSSPEHKRFEGKRMSDVIKASAGKKPTDVLFDLLIANNGSVPTVYFHHAEEDMRHALKQPFVSIGSDGTAVKTEGPLAKGSPHPRYYGTFPRVLGRYVREQNLISLEEAIRKMTSANAAKVRLYDRGLLRPGLWADVAVFDPARVIDKATFEKPAQYAVGVEYVIVNGKVVLDRGGKHTGARPGAILYGPGKR
jgi:N-acyl-D-aspartate/D-glutamate deacylase